MKRLLLLTLPAALGALAWSASIKGIIVDKSGEALPGASVQLVQMPDTLRAGYMLSRSDGDFAFSDVKPGRYYLLASMVSMADAYKEIAVKDSAENINAGRITLGEDAIMLQETVVTAIKAAVVAKQDTIEFNAGSFHTAPNANVSDLLKKLPGVEVSSDGTIKSNGKTISKVLVDGKEFFGDDTKMATENLPSELVEKVQVVDRKSDLARLTGVDDGEDETVINLTVKKSMNNGWFGSFSAGYGTDSRYEGSLTINRFSNGNQISIIGGLNNINESGFSDMGRGMFNFGGGGRGINSTQRLGVNFNIGNEESFRIGGNVMYSHSDRDSRNHSLTQYLFPDSVSFQEASNSLRDKGHNINADLRIRWKPDELNTFELRPRFSMNLRETSSAGLTRLNAGDAANTLVNTNKNALSGKGSSINASGELIYNHAFRQRKGRSLSLRASYKFSDSRQHSSSWSNIIYYLRHDDDEALYRYLDNRSWSNAIDGRLTWTEPLGDPTRGNFLNFAYRIQYRWNNADKLTYNLPAPENPEEFIPPFLSEVPAGAIFDPDLSNSFRNVFFTQELQAGYKKVSKKLRLDAGLLFSPSRSASTDLIDSRRDIPARWVWNIAPYANIRLKFADNSSFSARYRARTAQPSMSQLQPVTDVSDPLNIIIGNPALKPTFTQSLSMHINDFKAGSQQSVMGMLNISYALNSIVSKTLTDPESGIRTTTYGNVNGNLNIFGMGMINRPFTNRKWRFNTRLGISYSSTPGYINDDFNRTGSLNLSPSAGITFSSDIFQITLSPHYSFGRIDNTLPLQPGRSTHSYGFNGDASLYLPFGLELSTDIDFSKTSGYSQGYNSTQWLWNAQLSYSFLKDKSLTIYARAYDILGQNKDISRSVSANMISDNEYNDLTRYVMFGISWTFNTMRGKTRQSKEPGHHPDMPPPTPGERRSLSSPD